MLIHPSTSLSSMRHLAFFFLLSSISVELYSASIFPWPPGSEACTSDLNDDGVVGLTDLLEVLSHFGEPCDSEPPEPQVWPLIQFSELHYNPGTAQGSDAVYEFLELHNPTESAVDLGGWSITEGLDMNFPKGASISAGGYVVVTTAPITYSGLGYPVYDWGTGGLNNSGELLALRAPDGTVVESVEYSDSGDWDTAPDGQGPSLERLFLNGDPFAPTTWSASIATGGTPGSTNSLWLD